MIELWNNRISEKEIDNFLDAVSNRCILEGPILEDFQNRIAELIGVKYAIGTSSGTTAITLSLMGMGVKPGDEVIVPDITFIATANAAHILGAKVIVAPVDKVKLTLDFSKVDELITERTKVIITVDLNGRISCDRAMTEKYNKKGVMVIADSCQAFMSGNMEGMAGSLTNAGCFSFGITKTLTTAQGGMVVTNDFELYERMKIIKKQGMQSVFEGNYIYAGYNFKLPDVLAAIGMGQLERIDEKVKHMREISKMYYEELVEIEDLSFLPRDSNELIWMPEVVCQDRNKVKEVLKAYDIVSKQLYEPLHTADFLESPAFYGDIDEIQKGVLLLPGGTDQSFENVEKVIKVLKDNL